MADSPWPAMRVFEPALPAQCYPENDFLSRFSSAFHTCVPTNLAFLSTILGTLSILSWLCAQIPQVIKCYKLKSTSGLSPFFLGEWLAGDISNLLGCVFTSQALWQIIIAAYYVTVDCVLCGQWIWYERLRHGRPLISVWSRRNGGRYGGDGPGDMSEIIDGMSVMSEGSDDATTAPDGSKPVPHSKPKDVFRSPRYSSSPPKKEEDVPPTPPNRTIHRLGRSNSPMPSPRTLLYVSMLLAVVAQASPMTGPSPSHPIVLRATVPAETPTQVAGRVLSWMSTFLYLGSRMPQLYKNYVRKSTAGLSATLFAAAFLGNLFYSSSIIANPCAWGTYPAHGARGWVGSEGSDRGEWVGRATPFWLGAAGVLIMDAAVGVQFWYYGEGDMSDSMVMVPEEGGKKWRWRRLSGWMRGFIPFVPGGSEMAAPKAEEEQLLRDGADEGYGAV